MDLLGRFGYGNNTNNNNKNIVHAYGLSSAVCELGLRIASLGGFIKTVVRVTRRRLYFEKNVVEKAAEGS